MQDIPTQRELVFKKYLEVRKPSTLSSYVNTKRPCTCSRANCPTCDKNDCKDCKYCTGG